MGLIAQPSVLDSGGANNQSSISTASITPAPTKLIIVALFNKGPNNTAANLPSISGLSTTWHQVATHPSSFSSGEWRVTFFAGILTSTQTGTLTVSFGGQSQQSIGWAVLQFPANVWIDSTNPQNAILQSGSTENNGTVTSMTISLSAFTNSNNATLSVFADDGQSAFTGITGETTLVNLTQFGFNFIVGFTSSNQTSITANMGSNSTGKVALASEIKCLVMGAGGMLLV